MTGHSGRVGAFQKKVRAVEDSSCVAYFTLCVCAVGQMWIDGGMGSEVICRKLRGFTGTDLLYSDSVCR